MKTFYSISWLSNIFLKWPKKSDGFDSLGFCIAFSPKRICLPEFHWSFVIDSNNLLTPVNICQLSS